MYKIIAVLIYSKAGGIVLLPLFIFDLNISRLCFSALAVKLLC